MKDKIIQALQKAAAENGGKLTFYQYHNYAMRNPDAPRSYMIAREFGSFNAAKEAAGIQIRRRSWKVPNEQEIEKEKQQFVTFQRIPEVFGFPLANLHYWRDSGVFPEPDLIEDGVELYHFKTVKKFLDIVQSASKYRLNSYPTDADREKHLEKARKNCREHNILTASKYFRLAGMRMISPRPEILFLHSITFEEILSVKRVDETLRKVLLLHEKGATKEEIALRLRVSVRTVHRYFQELREAGYPV